MQSRIGLQFGNYQLTKRIGKGGYAEVYLAEHIHLPGRQHAIKVLTGTHLQNESRDEFLLEAQIIASLQNLNQHIVQIHDFGIQPDQQSGNSGTPYLVMEYASEGTLRDLYPYSTQVPLERILFYAKQIAEALYCVHTHQPPIVHRDIKPANMLLRNRDHVLLSDFGIAIPGHTGVLTPAGANLVGTAVYMAPERLLGHTRRASDQYALGIVVYEWLCGRPPFEGSNRDVCLRQLREEPLHLFPHYPHISQQIDTVVMRALSKAPEDRYANVFDFALALEEAIQTSLFHAFPGSQTPVPPVPLPELPSTPNISGRMRRRRRAFFELSSQFAEDARYHLFRVTGMFCNVLSAIVAGLLLQNVFAFVLGLLISSLLFYLCVRAVETTLAFLAGALVALYWGGIGCVIGLWLTASLQVDPAQRLPALLTGAVFCGVSFSLHTWYVIQKNS